MMKLLTYNIHYWEGTDGIIDVERTIDVIRATDADIVGLNEAYHPTLLAGLEQPALDYMAERLGMTYVFGKGQAAELAFESSGSSYGNAILSRWPILAAAAHHLTPVAGHAQRGLLEARILLPDNQRTLTVYVTHLDPQDEEVRLIQTQALLTWTTRDRNRPHVLLGDFNTYSPEDYAGLQTEQHLRDTVAALGWEMYEAQALPRLLRSGYTDAWIACGSGSAATYEVPNPRFRIDYIFVSRPLTPLLQSCHRIETGAAATASDHFPVLARLTY